MTQIHTRENDPPRIVYIPFGAQGLGLLTDFLPDAFPEF